MSSIVTPKYISGRKAGADLSAAAKRYTALQLESDGDVNTAAANEAEFIGFQQNLPESGKAVEIAGPGGGSKAIAAGTISPGHWLKTDSSGHLLAIGAYETARAVAFALEAAVDNDVFEVLVIEPRLVTGTSGLTPSYAEFTVTLAQVNAGYEMLPAVSGKKIVLHGFTFMANGEFQTGTAIELYDSATETNYASLAQAELDDNKVLMPGISGVTLGAAMSDGGAAGEGLSIGKSDATAFTNATNAKVQLLYSYV